MECMLKAKESLDKIKVASFEELPTELFKKCSEELDRMMWTPLLFLTN